MLPVRLEGGELAVETVGLVKRFGPVTALAGVDLQIPEGAVHVLIGPNGAGKSTLLRLLLGLERADAGEIRVAGAASGPPALAVRRSVGYVPERHDAPYPWLTVGRLMEHHRVYQPGWDDAYARHLSQVLELDASRRYGKLSKGHARRVQLALALAHRPPLLLLDEPTDGLDPVIRDETLALLAEHIADSPTTVLISTHRAYEVERLADHVSVLRDGRLLAQLPRERLHRELRRYRFAPPAEWPGASVLNGAVLHRTGTGRELEWTVWGEASRIETALSAGGCAVRGSSPLSLDEAAVALLRVREVA